MQLVLEQFQRIRALIPVPLALADCDVLARRDLMDVLEWIDAVEPQLGELRPPFRVSELGLVYAWASKFDVHADRAARKMSIAPPFTDLVRQKLQKKYGATEHLRRRWASEPDDAMARINSGIEEALHQFPELERWTEDDWSELFVCSSEVVTQTAAWKAVQRSKSQQGGWPTTLREPHSEKSMRLITDPTLRADPLWLAIDRVLRAIHDDRNIVFTKEPASEQGCNSETINRLATEARLAQWPVFEITELLQGNVKTDRLLKVHHPEVDEPVTLAIWRRYGTPDVPGAKLDRILTYLEAWRNKRASQLKPTAALLQESGSKSRFRIALSFPGERRDFVLRVAECLATHLGRFSILYDHFYEAEFARPDLDTYLQALYHDESDLICVFLCAEYEKKEWCGLEWRAIRDIIKRRRASDVMPFRFDMTEIAGLFSIDGYVWIGDREPDDIAERILERLSRNAAHSASSSDGTRASSMQESPSTDGVLRRAGNVTVSGILAAGDAIGGPGGDVQVQGGTGRHGAHGGDVDIKSGEHRAGAGGSGGKGGDIIIIGGDAE